ncbi:MAG: tRNA (N(6)-L-threonylcarbamoyladenosine(37)-C(2))-methylthiotransferase MtaB [Saprospiraceae bacterium]|nr:tRNA (N(6)-L-threonylcarbamoyladenosine(37)-C(2))-methylthiotransferase MtaB [Saprospiraceae bacterium]
MATPKTVSFHTLGCKLNFSETSSIRRQFESSGYTAVDFEEGADIYIINTCSVTDFADKKCRYEVRRALKYSPDAKVVVIGCYAQLKPEEISNIEGVDLVLGAAEKFNILKYIDEISAMSGKGMVMAGEVTDANTFIDSFSFGDRTRSFLKVQDGCDYKCTFCTIPQARGKSRSDTIENVIHNAQKIAELGVKEIVLTGVNIGDFGNGTAVIEGARPKKEAMFIDLIKALDEVEGIERYRISSIEPNLCTDEIINFVAESNRFVPHFHMPLQSGSDKILRLMSRRYKRELYKSRVEQIKAVMPHCCIGVDVIVGFPGETEEDFMETYQFLNELDVSYFHVFTYSERANTPANFMEDSVDMGIRKQRNKMLRILSSKKRRAFYENYKGTTRNALLEQSKAKGILNGFTDNYIKISVPEGQYKEGQLVDVELLEVEGDVMTSRVLKHRLKLV